MAIAHSATGEVGNETGNKQVTLAVAGTPAAGDFLVIHVATQEAAIAGTATWDTPTGWTQLSVQRNNAAVFYKVAAGGESNVTVTRAGNNARNMGRMMLFTADGTSALAGATSDTDLTLPTFTPDKENTMLVWLVNREDNSADFSAYAITTNDPGSWTERYEDDAAGAMSIAGATSAVRPQATATGDCTATTSGGTPNGFCFAIGEVLNASPAPAALTLTATQIASTIQTTSNVPVSALSLTSTATSATPTTQEFAAFTNTTKNAETATNTNKNAATATNTNKNAATATNTNKTQ